MNHSFCRVLDAPEKNQIVCVKRMARIRHFVWLKFSLESLERRGKVVLSPFYETDNEIVGRITVVLVDFGLVKCTQDVPRLSGTLFSCLCWWRSSTQGFKNIIVHPHQECIKFCQKRSQTVDLLCQIRFLKRDLLCNCRC